MNFWATRLAADSSNAPQSVTKAPLAPVQVQGAWFSNPLLTGHPAPSQAPQQPQVSTSDDAEIRAKTSKARAALNSGTCPSCGSGNYGRAPGSSNTYVRCLNCGENDRFSQAMQGAGYTGSEGPATPAAQVASGGGQGQINNFHPEIIVGKSGV